MLLVTENPASPLEKAENVNVTSDAALVLV